MSLKQVEQAVGFKVTRAVNLAYDGTCQYTFTTPSGDGTLDVAVITKNPGYPPFARDDEDAAMVFAKQRSEKSPYVNHLLRMVQVSALPGFGDDAYRAVGEGHESVIGVLKGTTYVELVSPDLKTERLLRLAKTTVAAL